MRKPIASHGLLIGALAFFPALFTFAKIDAASHILTVGQAGWREESRELAGYAGKQLVFNILIPTSLDRSSLRVGQVQISGKTAVPIGGVQPLESFVFNKSADAYGLTELTVELPVLQRKTLLALVVTTSTEPITKVAVIRVVVYPPFDWEPIARKLKSDDTRLVVFGKNQILRGFLQSKNVEFSNEGDELSASTDDRTIYLGVSATSALKTRKTKQAQTSGRVVFFNENDDVNAGVLSDLPPGIYVNERSKSIVTEVTLPVLDRLQTDPRCEEVLFQLIEQQLRPVATTTP